MNYKYLFGPVPSRRLGISLGVDLLPMKTCTLNCVYCECGPTSNLTLERREWVPVQGVMQELADYFAHNPQPDFVTFAGSGEPLLHSRIDTIIACLKDELHVPAKIAVLTNGTLLWDAQVRASLGRVDLVIPSLDAASQKTFKKINHPHPDLDLSRIIKGLVRFGAEFRGECWLEVFVLPGINDNITELMAIKDAILQIAPKRVQLNTLDRPGVDQSLRAASAEELEEIIRSWDLEGVEVIARPASRTKKVAYRKDVETAILETIARRPCTLEDLEEILALRRSEINKYLGVLQGQGKIRYLKQARGGFYKLVS